MGEIDCHCDGSGSLREEMPLTENDVKPLHHFYSCRSLRPRDIAVSSSLGERN